MKHSNLFKVISASVFTLSTVIMPLALPASAQVDPVDNPPEAVVRDRVYEDDGFDWGWLGLIGLFGLAGLGGKKRQEPTAYREPNR
jgi:hypothetical protein